jgi:proline dehydrogenase
LEISFDNTENAFKAKTDYELNRSFWLFKLIGNPALVKMGASLGPLAVKAGFKGLIKKTIFKQFVGGENINDCTATIEQLGKYNIGTILDYSVEGKEDEKDFDNCLEETLAGVQKAKELKHIPFCVFKVTGLARFAVLEKISANKPLTQTEEQEWQRVRNRVSKICSSALEHNQPIFIDAEESWIQQAIDDLANENMMLCNKNRAIIFNTFQLYRHDRLQYLNESIQHAKSNNYHLGAKLVRGAYMEKERARAAQLNYPSPIQPDKESTDRDYNQALKLSMDHIDMMALCAGTHNEQSSYFLTELMKESKIEASDKRVWFSQLFGMSDHISYNLSDKGFNVAKYVPYGPVAEVLPYLIRRALENTSVKGQTSRELGLIIKEKKRRSSVKR